MVLRALFASLLISFVFAGSVEQRVKSYVDEKTYTNNAKLIGVIFKNKENMDDLEIIATLISNGLYDIARSEPVDFEYEFTTSAHYELFSKIIPDALYNIGYTMATFDAIELNDKSLNIKYKINTKNNINPIMLNDYLAKRGVKITSVTKRGAIGYKFVIDTDGGFIDSIVDVSSGEAIGLSKPHRDYYLNVGEKGILDITSDEQNRWFPDIGMYDSHFKVLKVYKSETSVGTLTLTLPPKTRYLRVSDLYNLSNLKKGLVVQAK